MGNAEKWAALVRGGGGRIFLAEGQVLRSTNYVEMSFSQPPRRCEARS